MPYADPDRASYASAERMRRMRERRRAAAAAPPAPSPARLASHAARALATMRVQHEGADLHQVIEAIGGSGGEVRQLLDRLVAFGLARQDGQRWQAVPG